MAAVVSRESYFEVGLEVLSELGYGGLKLAEVCHRLGVTTGSFYHYFPNWPTFTRELVAHWLDDRTSRLAEVARTEPDPRRRIGALAHRRTARRHARLRGGRCGGLDAGHRRHHCAGREHQRG